MKIKVFLLTLLSFANLALYASPDVDNAINSSEPQEFTYCIREDQKIDTQDWVSSLITNGFVDSEKGVTHEETIELLFPNEPEYLEEEGFRPALHTASDDEGMTYSVSYMKIPNEDFNLDDSVNFLTEALKRSDNKKLNFIGKTENSPDSSSDLSRYIFGWVNNENQFTRLMIVRGQYFVYFLETSVTDEIYQNIDTMEIDDPVFERVMHDSLKTGAFNNSLRISGEVTVGE